jgi:hypothetical protein
MKDFDNWLKWVSTGFLVGGSIAASMNIYPLNIILSLMGNLGWFWAGWRMKEPSLWSVSLFLLAVYGGGIIYATTNI